MTSLAFTDIKQLYDVIVMETAEMLYVESNWKIQVREQDCVLFQQVVLFHSNVCPFLFY